MITVHGTYAEDSETPHRCEVTNAQNLFQLQAQRPPHALSVKYPSSMCKADIKFFDEDDNPTTLDKYDDRWELSAFEVAPHKVVLIYWAKFHDTQMRVEVYNNEQ